MDVEWFSVPDVARRLNKCQKTVLNKIHRGELVAHMLDDRTYSVASAELEAFIAKRRVYPGDAAGVAVGTGDLSEDRVVVSPT